MNPGRKEGLLVLPLYSLQAALDQSSQFPQPLPEAPSPGTIRKKAVSKKISELRASGSLDIETPPRLQCGTVDLD